jgi:4-amino-4-deoxy-L-arabinose transferase-like glycosyltransferase
MDRRWLLLACLIPFMGFWAYGLFDLDEGFYGAVVTDMVRRHDWITPTLTGAPWFEKPILSYWLAIPSVMAFGNEFGARLPSFLCTLATVWAWHRFARRHAPEISILLPLAYAGSLLVTGIGRMMMTDSAFVLFLTLAFHTFYESIVRGPRWLVGVFLGLAVLAKGPVALVVFSVAVGVMAWRSPDVRASMGRGWTAAGLLFLGVVTSWFVPCYLANRSLFVDEFLIKQNIGRFAGGDTAHASPLWTAPFYFPLILLIALLPLSAYGFRGLLKGFRPAWNGEQTKLEVFLWAWAGVVLALFSLSGTKLPHYILPAVGPFAALLCLVLRSRARTLEGTAVLWCGAAGACAVVTFSMIDRAQFADVRRVSQVAGQSSLPVATCALSGVHRPGVSVSLNEQSSPSIGFYLRRPFQEFGDAQELSDSNFTGLVITRAGRVDAQTVLGLALHGTEIHQQEPRGLSYELWRVEPSSAVGRVSP